AAWCFLFGKANGWLTDPDRDIADGVRLARRAAAVGREDPTALWASGYCLAYLAGELETGATHIERALALNPNLAAAWSASGWVRTFLGEPADAIQRFERAMRLSPLDPFAYYAYVGMGAAHVFAGRYDEAASWAQKASHEQPNLAPAWRVAAIAYALSDRIVEGAGAMGRLPRDQRPFRAGQSCKSCGAIPSARPRALYRGPAQGRVAGIIAACGVATLRQPLGRMWSDPACRLLARSGRDRTSGLGEKPTTPSPDGRA